MSMHDSGNRLTLFQRLRLWIFRLAGRTLPSMEDRARLAAAALIERPHVLLHPDESVVCVKTRGAERTFVITSDLLRQVVHAVSQLNLSPDRDVSPNVANHSDDSAVRESVNYQLQHFTALSRCAIDFMEWENRELYASAKTPILTFFILARAAGIKFPEGWIEERLFGEEDYGNYA